MSHELEVNKSPWIPSFLSVFLKAHTSPDGYLSQGPTKVGDNQTKLSRQATLLQGTVLETGFMI